MTRHIEVAFGAANVAIHNAVTSLTTLKKAYQNSDLEQNVKLARIAALDAKIDYLDGLMLNPNAHPWVGDGI